MMQGRAFLGQVPLQQPGQALTDLAKKKRECWVLSIQYDKAKAAYDSDQTDENYQEYYDLYVALTNCDNEQYDLQNSPGGMAPQPEPMPKVNIEPGAPPIPEYNPWPVVQTPPVAPETPSGPTGNVWLNPQSLVQQTSFASSYGNSWGGSSPFSMSGRRF